MELTREQREQAEEICQHIDPGAFPRVRPEELADNPDTVLISEALVTGHAMLITGNMRSIEHNDVMHWAQANAQRFGIENPRVLHVQDEIMPSIFSGPLGREKLCEIAISSAWPGDEHTKYEEVEQALKGMLQACPGARLEDTGTKIEEFWRTTNRREEVVEHVRTKLPIRMLESERRHPAYRNRRDSEIKPKMESAPRGARHGRGR